MSKAKYGDQSNRHHPVIPHHSPQVPRHVGHEEWLFCPNCASAYKRTSGRQAGYQKFVCRFCSQRWSVLVAFADSDDTKDEPLTLANDAVDVIDAVESANQTPSKAPSDGSPPKLRVLERDRYSPAFELEAAASLQFQHRLFLELEAAKTSCLIAQRTVSELLIERDHLQLLARDLERQLKRLKRESNSAESSQGQGS
jgi:hypothetical protein